MRNKINSLEELKAEVRSISERKIDFTKKSSDIRMAEDDLLLFNSNGIIEKMRINDVAHSQISNKLNIPKKYYDNMTKIPGLRSQNVNSWLMQEKDEKNYMIRTLDNNARAFLSDRFRPIDNHFILKVFMPVLENKEIQIVSSSLTEKKMYLQIVFPGIQADVEIGDTVQAGIIMTNSEVGCGAVDISHIIWRLTCKNGMIGQSVLNKYHIGRKVGNDIEDYNIFKDDTIKAELISFQKRLRDVLDHTISQSYLESKVAKMRKAVDDKINNVQDTIKNVTDKYILSDLEESLIINNMINEGSANRWTLANSVTAMSHELLNQDRQYDIEKIGNDIIELKPNEWEVLSA